MADVSRDVNWSLNDIEYMLKEVEENGTDLDYLIVLHLVGDVIANYYNSYIDCERKW